MRNVPDYLMCIGAGFYTPAEFTREAQAMGISRRLACIPTGLVPGKSRVYCAYEATRDCHVRTCSSCKGAIVPIDPDDLHPTSVKCAACGATFPIKNHRKANINNYFIPDRIEVVLRVSAQAARDSVNMAAGLGLFAARLEETPETLRAVCQITGDAGEAIKTLAKMAGVEADADLIAPAITQHGVKVVLVSHEPERGCGQRKHGGTYAVTNTNTNKSPLIEIEPPIPYLGQHFRGLKQLENGEALDADDHVLGICTVELAGKAADKVSAQPLF